MNGKYAGLRMFALSRVSEYRVLSFDNKQQSITLSRESIQICTLVFTIETGCQDLTVFTALSYIWFKSMLECPLRRFSASVTKHCIFSIPSDMFDHQCLTPALLFVSRVSMLPSSFCNSFSSTTLASIECLFHWYSRVGSVMKLGGQAKLTEAKLSLSRPNWSPEWIAR